MPQLAPSCSLWKCRIIKEKKFVIALFVATAAKKLKLRNFTGEAKNLIINNAIFQKEELGEMSIQDSKHVSPPFDMRQRNKLCFKSFTANPMHLLGL